MTDDLSDLLGFDEEPAPKPKAKRKGKRKYTRRIDSRSAAGSTEAYIATDDPDLEHIGQNDIPDATEFWRPVRVSFLSVVFGITLAETRKKLIRCPVAEWDKIGGTRHPVYDFKTAVGYLIEPKVNIADWIRRQNPSKLPVGINKAFWEAENHRLKFMERAAELWHDDDVLDVLGRTALMIKETTQLWVEGMPGKEDMTTKQFNHLQKSVGQLLDLVYDRLVTIPSQRRTSSIQTALTDENVTLDEGK